MQPELGTDVQPKKKGKFSLGGVKRSLSGIKQTLENSARNLSGSRDRPKTAGNAATVPEQKNKVPNIKKINSAASVASIKKIKVLKQPAKK